MQERKPDLKIHIIAPSSYDDNGILKQYWKTLMLPPAFAVLDGIALKAAQDSNISVAIEHHEERTKRGDGYLDSIIKDQSAFNKVVFITAKSHELPRAVDLALVLKRFRIPFVLGGPGVTLADTKIYDYFIQEGIPFNVGEGENTVPQIMRDVVREGLRPAYWQRGFVDLRKAPLPKIPDEKELARTINRWAAIGTSEGCPFGCPYCSVIVIRGRKLTADRSRNVSDIMAFIEEIHRRGFQAMATDDNFRFSYIYGDLMREMVDFNEGLRRKNDELYVFNQMDAREDVIKDVEILGAAGVKHSFFGMESTDPLVLAGTNKKHNNPARYRDIVNECHKEEITVSTGLMLAFPNQTPESIRAQNIEFRELVDLAHPYLVTPLPGTPDYFDAVRQGEIATWDLNKYDTTHAVRNWLKNMTREEAEKAYRQSFDDLFSKSAIFERDGKGKRKVSRLGYARILTTIGKVYGRPFHFMMDGIPHIPPIPWQRVKRPMNGFTGFPLDSEDPAYRSKEANKEHKTKYLSAVAWSIKQDAVEEEITEAVFA